MSKPILLIDCFDSFTFNLVHYIESFTEERVQVVRPDTADALDLSAFSAVVFSPGPGLPGEVPNLISTMKAAMVAELPILGVCLGLQAMAEAAGAQLKQLAQPYHGVAHPTTQVGQSELFRHIPETFESGRYHSWMVEESSLGQEWNVIARDFQGDVMAMSHSDRPWYGIQFHPESVLTPLGLQIIGNFLAIALQR